MRTCLKVRGIAAHCVRLCTRNGETTAGLTELTINCSNNMYWYVEATPLQARALRLIFFTRNTREHKSKAENTNQRFEVFIYK